MPLVVCTLGVALAAVPSRAVCIVSPVQCTERHPQQYPCTSHRLIWDPALAPSSSVDEPLDRCKGQARIS